MRWKSGGVLLLLLCAVAATAAPAPSSRTIVLHGVRHVVFDSPARLHLLNGANGEFVRFEGAADALAGASATQRGQTLLIHTSTASLDVYLDEPALASISMSPKEESRPIVPADECNIAVAGAARAHLDSVVGSIVRIYVDGAARLDVDKVTAGIVATTGSGEAKIKRD